MLVARHLSSHYFSFTFVTVSYCKQNILVVKQDKGVFSVPSAVFSNKGWIQWIYSLPLCLIPIMPLANLFHMISWYCPSLVLLWMVICWTFIGSKVLKMYVYFFFFVIYEEVLMEMKWHFVIRKESILWVWIEHISELQLFD